MRRLAVLTPLAMLFLSLQGVAGAQILRSPAINRTSIVFVYADDLWIVPRDGGTATRLTSSPGPESHPRFSPDGATIAFTGAHDGIYTLPVAGGTPRRITHSPRKTTVCSWTADGRVLFMTDAFSHIFDGDGQARVRQLFTVAANGGLPRQLPVPYGANGTIDASGEWLAYTPYAEGLTEKRKRYVGGFAPDIWLFNLRDHRSRKMTDWKGADTSPMWLGRTLFYLSDAGTEGRMNVWSYDTATDRRYQVTHFPAFDVKWPSVGPGPDGRGEIVFNYGTDLYVLDIGSTRSRRVKVTLPADLAPKDLAVDASKFVASWSLSPEGDRAAIEARGDVWTVALDGRKRQLTASSGAAERDPSWSPDGRWISFFSDSTGEYELYVAAADGSSKARRLTNLGSGFRHRPVWSPDSRHIAFFDSTGTIYVHTLDPKQTARIDRDPLVRSPQMSWSSDSRWLAYARGADRSPRYTAIWLFSLETRKARQVTSGSFDDKWPAFDRSGRHLYFVSARNFRSLTFDSVDYNNFVYPTTDVVLVVPLRPDVGPPWAPAAAGTQSGISLENFEHRALVAVRDQGKYSNLAVASDGQLTFSFTGRDGRAFIKMVDLRASRDVTTILEGFGDFKLSANGRAIAVRQDNDLAIVDPRPNQKLERRIKLQGLNAVIDARAEGHQIFHDAWRLYRDNFFDARMRGVDWPEIRVKYAKLLDACVRREDVYEVIGEMFGELGSSHVFLWMAPGEQAEPEKTGTIGVDYEIDRDAYRIARIYDGAVNDPFWRNFLHRGTANVKEGEYLLAVNGVPLDTRQAPWVAFKGLAGKTATLTIGSAPGPRQATREAAVEIVHWDYETVFRNLSWVEANRAHVDRRTGGRVGYIYLADTHDFGSREFTRQFNDQLDKDGLILDGRWNEGGHVPFHVLDVLGRRRDGYHHDLRRSAGGRRTPDYLHEGPLCLLTNGVTVSGGDELAYLFQKRGLGKVVGTPTMGGMVGVSADLKFVDGGGSTVPIVGFYDESGKWVIEGYGVEPDIRVLDDPARMLNGGDPQLDEAIRTVLEQLGAPRKIPPVP